MPTDSLLLVLVVREAGLRSALVARLGMTGADLLTVEDRHDPQIARSRHAHRVLIADDAGAIGGDGWQRIVLIGSEGAPDGAICIERANAAAEIAARIAEWRVAD